MIVDRKKFKKFWKLPWNLPDIVFCNEKYYLPSLNEVKTEIIPLYEKILKEYNLDRNNSWDCSKFSEAFKFICDVYYKQKDNQSHFAVAIAHIKMKTNEFDHALNLIFYYENNNIDYIFFEPQTRELFKDKNNVRFKNIKFLYF